MKLGGTCIDTCFSCSDAWHRVEDSQLSHAVLAPGAISCCRHRYGCQTILTVNCRQKQVFVKAPTDDNMSMTDTARTVALCCYKDRAVVSIRCELCKSEYACLEFRTKAAVMQFNAMIPPSMLLAPLPIELWPNMCADIAPGMSSQPIDSASNESTESPLRRFGSTLGLPIERDPHST